MLIEIENAESDLDSILGTLHMATGRLEHAEQPDDIRPLYVCANAIDQVRKSLLSLERKMIDAKRRGQAWDIGGAA